MLILHSGKHPIYKDIHAEALVWLQMLTLILSCSCLQAKHYNAAASVLEQTIYDVEPAKTNMKPTDLLLYCYYGGMIHIGEHIEACQTFDCGQLKLSFEWQWMRLDLQGDEGTQRHCRCSCKA